VKQALFLSARLAALRGESRLCADALALNGLSDRNLRLLLNNLGAAIRTYVEVGTYTGSSLVAASQGNPVLTAVGIDNFSERFDAFYAVADVRKTLQRNLRRFAPHARVIEADFRQLDPHRIPEGIDCLFYDGAHDYQSQQAGVAHFATRFADQCILLIDDWNGEDVRNGTYRGLDDVARHTGHQVEFSAALCDTWNNVGVFVLRRSGLPERLFE
jgi:hypothetical protein